MLKVQALAISSSLAAIAGALNPEVLSDAGKAGDAAKYIAQRLDIRDNLLEDVAGIHERRIWDGPVTPSDAATWAAQKALAQSGVAHEAIGIP